MNRSKIIQMLLILTGIVIIAASLARMAQRNSMTLSEYATENRTLSAGDIADETAPPLETREAVEENLQASSPEPTPSETPETTTLTGALLNADALEDRITYTDGFYYEPLSENLRRFITGVSYPRVTSEEEENTLAIGLDELSYVHIWYVDFEGNPAEGELICNQAIAQDLVEIFYELYRNEYQLESIRLIDEFDGDDIASMEANNTSCFNYRVVDGTKSLSKHALGLAIDVNPFYNPYVTYENGNEKVSPAAAESYADRSASFAYKIDENDLCYKLFTQHGFTWGGNWNSVKDYQHFQKTVE